MKRRVGMIVVGHGTFAQGLLSPMRMLMGDIQDFCEIEFPVGMAEEELEAQIILAAKKFEKHDEILILTDIEGGTPFKMAVKVAYENQYTVITGVNLPLVLQLAMLLDTYDSANIEEILEKAREALKVISVKNLFETLH